MGRTIVITGATGGLGQAAALDFARGGDRVILVGRDAARGAQTESQIRAAGGTADFVRGDVSTRAGVAAVAAAVRALVPSVDVLVNNAGGTFDARASTAEGVETTLALNVVGPFLLEKALHAELVAAKGRVVNVVTGFLDWYPVDVDDLLAPKRYNGMTQYARCKHAALMMTVEQARRLEPDGIRAVALHPGIIMGTQFGGGQPKVVQAVAGPLLRLIGLACTQEEAVRRFRVAAFDDVPSGSYVVKGLAAPLPKQAEDAAVRAQVMALIEGVTAASPA